MDWVKENWFFLLIFVFFIGMHLSGHGCGGHGGHGQKKDEEGHDGHSGQIPSEKKNREGEH